MIYWMPVLKLLLPKSCLAQARRDGVVEGRRHAPRRHHMRSQKPARR
jgi:hypothetical protein